MNKYVEIYKITCKIFNVKADCYKNYIGMTLRTVEERFKEHCESGGCKAFNAAIKKYGKDNWILEILEDNINT